MLSVFWAGFPSLEPCVVVISGLDDVSDDMFSTVPVVADGDDVVVEIVLIMVDVVLDVSVGEAVVVIVVEGG